ncbi:hypothetical protein PTQ35_02160 [Campylobacter sp. 46490-21]|uniref:hypothetical protein n=1 Tax=Campylobacter magnus TaxID=3026462 RepID=UPI00235EE808|nr:hypothetical protein [Campylobacter magnus]MDD0847615.1 hypothetical protein [Campylobacter magnus]
MCKKIVLFGGSNSVVTNGLRAGLSTFASLKVLALGGSTSIQNLYELYRKKNQEYIKNADLIVTESNLNEISHHSQSIDLSLDLIALHCQWFYESLVKYNKPVCVLILPFWGKDYEKINNFHRYFSNLYGFNIIDVYEIYRKYDLKNFAQKIDKYHQMNVIMRKIGKNISKNIDIFHSPNKDMSSCKLPYFKVLTPNEMIKHGEFKIFTPSNSLFDEIVFRLNKKNYLSIKPDSEYISYNVIGLHGWNLEEDGNTSRDIRFLSLHCRNAIALGNDINQVRKDMAKLNQFHSIQSKLVISDDFIVKQNSDYIVCTEISLVDKFLDDECSYSSYFDLVSLFLCSEYNRDDFLDLKLIPNGEIIDINPKLNFTNLVPNIEFYSDCMDFIDEYFEYLKPKIKEYIQNNS